MEIEFKEKIENKMKTVNMDETNIIKCSNCDKKLVHIFVKQLDKKTFYKLVVECPFCKDKSFELEIKGILGIHPCDGVLILNIETNEEKMVKFYRTGRS